MNALVKGMKLSRAQIMALRDCETGDPMASCRGRSSFGGRCGTLYSLRKAGLINAENFPTGAGYEYLSTANAHARKSDVLAESES